MVGEYNIEKTFQEGRPHGGLPVPEFVEGREERLKLYKDLIFGW